MANFGSSIAWPLIILGFFFNSSTTSSLFINLGILAFSLAVLFQIVTLPVEFDASHRALKILGNTGMLYEDEVRDTRKVLTAAALTYVAGRMQASVNERELVLDMLLQITRDGEYSHIVIKNVLDKYQYLDKRERAFITRVVNGTLERMIEIDYIINLFSKVKVNKMKPLIRTILRSSVYQMKYMDSVPDSAICNEAVKLAGKRGFVNLKGFVNGVLRNISRNLDKINYPDEKDKVSYLSVKYSLPEWLVKQWLNVYDEETVKTIGSAFLEEKPLTVRFNEHKIKKEDLVGILKKEGVTVGEVPEIPCALYLSGYDHLSALPSFCEGLYQVQDLSSMQVALWSEVKEGDQVLDVCAAPGGKSTELAAKLHGKSI